MREWLASFSSFSNFSSLSSYALLANNCSGQGRFPWFNCKNRHRYNRKRAKCCQIRKKQIGEIWHEICVFLRNFIFRYFPEVGILRASEVILHSQPRLTAPAAPPRRRGPPADEGPPGFAICLPNFQIWKLWNVFGCIGIVFCNLIYVVNHVFSSTRPSSWIFETWQSCQIHKWHCSIHLRHYCCVRKTMSQTLAGGNWRHSSPKRLPRLTELNWQNYLCSLTEFTKLKFIISFTMESNLMPVNEIQTLERIGIPHLRTHWTLRCPHRESKADKVAIGKIVRKGDPSTYSGI